MSRHIQDCDYRRQTLEVAGTRALPLGWKQAGMMSSGRRKEISVRLSEVYCKIARGSRLR